MPVGNEIVTVDAFKLSEDVDADVADMLRQDSA
jgi:hypothetical protein